MTHEEIMRINELSKFDNEIIVGSEIRGIVAEYEKQKKLAEKYKALLNKTKVDV